MTKHSNMLVFGTNTSVGLNVGTDASQTPTIQIGINRQEVALVPLLANTKASQVEKKDANDNTYTSSTNGDLEPCPAAVVGADGKTTVKVDINGCAFVASSTTTIIEKDKEGKPVKTTISTANDSYSTLASFGTKTQANGEGASASVAQYFATGVAAQELARNGGANVVQADSNSGKKAEAESEKAKAEAEKAKYDALAADYIKNTVKPSGVTIAAKIDTNNDGKVQQGEIDLLDPHVNAAVQANLDQLKDKPVSEFIAELEKLIPLDVEKVANAL